MVCEPEYMNVGPPITDLHGPCQRKISKPQKVIFTNDIYEKETALLKYVWDLKRKDNEYGIKWSILYIARLYKKV